MTDLQMSTITTWTVEHGSTFLVPLQNYLSITDISNTVLSLELSVCDASVVHCRQPTNISEPAYIHVFPQFI